MINIHAQDESDSWETYSPDNGFSKKVLPLIILQVMVTSRVLIDFLPLIMIACTSNTDKDT